MLYRLIMGSGRLGEIAPRNLSLPTITGSAVVGEVLTLNLGDWQAVGDVTYTRQVLRDGAAIEGALGDQYTLVEADAGKMIRLRVTAENEYGETVVESEAIGPIDVAPVSPNASGAAVIYGGPAEGSTLYVRLPTITAQPDPDYAYQWYSETFGEISGLALEIDATDPTLADITVYTSETSGTIWFVVALASATAPSAAQIVAGTDGDDAAAVWTDSYEVQSIDAYYEGVTGLAAGQTYTAYAVYEDDGGAYSAVISSASGGRVEITGATGATIWRTSSLIDSVISCDLTVSNYLGSITLRTADYGPITGPLLYTRSGAQLLTRAGADIAPRYASDNHALQDRSGALLYSRSGDALIERV
jgi:hypothetical protein